MVHEILKQKGCKAGSQDWITHYQAAVSEVMKTMSAEQLKEADETAKEWNVAQPPPEVQLK